MKRYWKKAQRQKVKKIEGFLKIIIKYGKIHDCPGNRSKEMVGICL